MNKKIGILGTSCSSTNLGCAALQYSAIGMLDEISKDLDMKFSYNIFDFGVTDLHKKLICRELNVDWKNLNYYEMPRPAIIQSMEDLLRHIKYWRDNQDTYSAMRNCDVIIDMTQGDSFSDIYGKRRFYEWTKIKEKILGYGIPLILGPQTYGPFEDETIKDKAKSVIEKASLVIARDVASKKYVEEMCSRPVILGTDLAFHLSYNKVKHESNRIKVGINPSGLLGKKKTDISEFNRKLSVDYEEYLKNVITWLKEDNKYEIHMISHVGNEAIESFGYVDGVVYHECFDSPVKAKNCISGMDIFIGARMHATIAALSSGVATIPVAYSRKFTGLFKGIQYNYLIDLEHCNTEEAVNQTIEYIKRYIELKCSAEHSMQMANEYFFLMQREIAYHIKQDDVHFSLK